MKPLTIMTFAAATIAALAGTALGDMHTTRPTQRRADAQLQRLEAARMRAVRDRVAWEADKAKGTPRQERLDGLIADVEHGRPAQPDDIDRANRVR
jgi:hypothetical protein